MTSARSVLTAAGISALGLALAFGPNILQTATAVDQIPAGGQTSGPAGPTAPQPPPTLPAPKPTIVPTPGVGGQAALPGGPSGHESGASTSSGARPTHENSRPIAYLTFDDGPDPVWTPQVLAVLRQYQAQATFFMIGDHAGKHRPMVWQVRAAGHAVGNHTWSHPWLTGLSTAQIRSELRRTDSAVGSTTCVRPPGGLVNGVVRGVARSEGKSVALWDVDTGDWRRPGADRIAAVGSHLRPGAIVLMHDGGGDRSQTVAALHRVLTSATQRGYVFRALPSCR